MIVFIHFLNFIENILCYSFKVIPPVIDVLLSVLGQAFYLFVCVPFVILFCGVFLFGPCFVLWCYLEIISLNKTKLVALFIWNRAGAFVQLPLLNANANIRVSSIFKSLKNSLSSTSYFVYVSSKGSGESVHMLLLFCCCSFCVWESLVVLSIHQLL